MKKPLKTLAILSLGLSLFSGASFNKADAAYAPTGQKLHLPASDPTWTVYKMGHPLQKSNSDNIAGILKPSKFGGLTYDILGSVGPYSYVIQTSDFGQVEIYAGPGTGAEIMGDSSSPTPTPVSTATPAPSPTPSGNTITLPADALTWTVYKMGAPLVKSNPANIAGVLKPSKFGGLTYSILGTVGPNSYVIQTDSFGKVEIYGGPETGAQVSNDGKVPAMTPPPVPTSWSAPVVSSNTQSIINFAEQYMGMPYVWGGSTPSTSFDCSGYIYWVFKNNGYNIYRTNVEGYWNMTDRIQHVSNPQVGDLVFFQNTYKAGPSHIGIYIGNGQYINANSSRGVAIDNLSSSWAQAHLLGFGHFMW